MKRETDKQIGYDSNVVFDGYDAKISESDMDKLWDLLQDPYKNSIGAVVREYVSNSFDSHAEAKFIKENSVEDIRKEYSIYNNYTDDYIYELKERLSDFNDDPVIVTISKDDTGHYWATEDFGVGLSPERVRDVFCNYLKSTKEDTNNLIGAFGIGSKSGLSYTDVVYIRTRYNGTEYFYMLRKGEKSPRLDVVMDIPTDERNGTEIKVYIKTTKQYSWSNPQPETHRFQEECKKQLAYFDNVYFKGTNIANDYTIIEGDNWKISSNGNPFSGLHMCLGKVAYPIDWDSLGEESIKLPVALKFDIGELDIIQTREDVKYTPRTKEAILNKIKALKQELLDRWKAENEYETDNFINFIKNRHNNIVLNFTTKNYSSTLYLSELFSDKEMPKWKFIPYDKIGFNVDSFEGFRFFVDYHSPNYVNNTGLKHQNNEIATLIKRNAPCYRIVGTHDSRKSKYIANTVDRPLFYFVREKADATINLKHYKTFLKLENYPKSEWRTIISTVQKEEKKALLAFTKSYQNTIIDPDWLKAQRSARKSSDNTVFNIYKYDDSYSYSGAFKAHQMKKRQIEGSKRILYVAGLKEDQRWLRFVHYVLTDIYGSSKKRYFNVFYVAPSNVKYLKDAVNLINPLNYMENRIFIKAVTAIKIARSPEFESLREILSHSSKYSHALLNINPEISKLIDELSSFTTNYNSFNNIELNSKFYSKESKESFIISVYNYVESKGLFDKKYLEIADKVQDFFKNVPLITNLRQSEITEQNLSVAFYRFNKSAPKQFWKKINPMLYVNLNDEEFKWLEKVEQNRYKRIHLIP